MKTVFSADDYRYMALAVDLAERGRFSARPNPMVGCILVRDGAIVGQGWHQITGGPHAEVVALQDAGAKAVGATAYVTLEPCCHTGRTGPCSDALREAGVRRVVAAMEDPNPRVSGQGLAQLRAAGVVVESGLLESQARQLNRGFISRMARGRPFVRLKLAASLDGQTAMASGESRWITGAAARHDVQWLRAASGAVLTGSGTVLADDPAMTVREPDAVAKLQGLRRFPVRVVLDTHLRTEPRSRIYDGAASSWLFTAARDHERETEFQQIGVDVVRVPTTDRGLDLNMVLASLAQREINDVMVEAGPTLAGQFVEQGLADELVIYLAPTLLGQQGRGLLKVALHDLTDRIDLRLIDLRMIGDDFRVTAAVAASSGT